MSDGHIALTIKKTTMKKLFFVLVSLSVFLSTQSFSCKKDATPVSSTTIEVTVKDGNSWSISNTSLSIVSGATVYFYATQADVTNNTPQYTAATDATGVVKIPVNFQTQYFLLVQKGSAKNLYNGYLITGIFQSQSDIQASAFQVPAPVIGGLKFGDLNGDGKIDSNDKTFADNVSPVLNQNITKTSIIAQ